MSDEKATPEFKVDPMEELDDEALDDVSGGSDCSGCSHVCSASCGSDIGLQR